MQPIAIIASSFRLPRNLDSLDSIIHALANKQSQITRLGWERWNHDLVYHPDRARRGKTYSDFAGLLDGNPNNFDPRPFDINRREADQMDPQQKILLELTHETIDRTLYTRQDLIGRDIGVFMGVSSTDSGFLYGQDNLAGDSYFMTGTTQSLVSNRISHIFGWNGPNTPMDTACSSSLVALDAGLKSLNCGETEMVLVGGVSILLNPMSFVGFSAANMLSQTGQCHVFDQAADGYVRGEGAGVILLKPLAQALKDGDQVHAIIRSAGISHNGENKLVSFPKQDAQAALIKNQMEQAGVGPQDFAYFEAHGTGTPVGDPSEAYAIGISAGHQRKTPIPIGSIKGNIGHLEPASGIAGIAKALAIGKSKNLLPQANFKTPSETIKFNDWNIRVVDEIEAVDFSKSAMIGINSFGFGGVNGSVILEIPSDEQRTTVIAKTFPRNSISAHLVEPRLIVDAFSQEALDHRMAQIDELLSKTSKDDLAATLSARLDRGKFRAVRSCDPEQNRWVQAEAARSDKGPVFIFSGNGAQRPGMGRAALKQDKTFREAFAKVAAFLEPELGFDPLKALLDEEYEVDLDDTSISQPLLFALQAAYVDRIALDGLKPAAVIGHSVGEVAAAYACGALSLEAACKVIVARSSSQNATRNDGKMFAVIANADTLNIEDLKARFDAHIAGYNSNKVTAITVLGDQDGFVTEMEKNDIRCIDVSIEYPFHSPGMDCVRDPLVELLDDLEAQAPQIPMFSTMKGGLWQDGILNADYWWQNVREPVQFVKAVTAALEQGYQHFLEISPFPIMVRHINDIAKDLGAEVGATQIDNMSDQENQTNRSLNERIERFWAMGALVNQEQFVGVEAKIVPGIEIPSYPWHREWHGMSFTDDGPVWRLNQRQHPLLGDHRSPNSMFRNDIDHLRYPFLKDHQVQNRVLYPGAGTMELMLSAVRALHKFESDETVRLKDFQLLRPMELSEDEWTSVQTRLDDVSNQIVVETRPGVQQGNYRIHAKAQVLPGITSASNNFQCSQINSKDLPVLLDREKLYKITEELDLQYGPHFRCVESVRKLSDTTIIADLIYPGDPMADERDTVQPLAFHPGLLDGAFQAALALLVNNVGENAIGLQTYVPQGVDEIHFFGNENTACRAKVELRLVSEESVITDISLYDETGAPVIGLERLRLMPMPSSARPNITRETLQVPYWVNANTYSEPLTIDNSQAPDSDGEWHRIEKLAQEIAVYSFQKLGQRLKNSANELQLSDAIEKNAFSEEQLPYVLALLSKLDDAGFAGTEDGDLWTFEQNAPSYDDLHKHWRELSGEFSGWSSYLNLLAHRLDHFENILAGEANFLSAEVNTLASLLRGPQYENIANAIGRALAQWILAGDNGSQKRICIRIIGAEMSNTIAAIQAACRRALPYASLEWQIVEDDANIVARSQVDLAGFAGVSFITAEELGTSFSPDAIILLPQAFANLFTQDEKGIFDSITVNADEGCPIIAVQNTDSFVTDFLFGIDEKYWSVDEESGLPIPKDHALGDVEKLFVMAGHQVDKTIQVDNSKITHSRISQAYEGYHPHVIHILPSAFPDNLQGYCALDVRSLKMEEFANDLHHTVRCLANADCEQLSQFVLITDAQNEAHTALAAALACVANENNWENYLHLIVDHTPTFEAKSISEYITCHRNEAEVMIRHDGAWVKRYAPIVDDADGESEAPVFSRRLRGVLDPVSRRPAKKPKLQDDEILLEAHASGLNFRDVMYAMRLLPAEALEDGYTGATIGMEAAGIVTAKGKDVTRFEIGDPVVAFASDAFASHVKAKERASVPLPENINAAEAATLLTSYVTAWYGLVECARVQKGDLVLVQAGAGALGLAAIQVAKYLGCNVAATAGSSLKQSVVKAAGADFVCYSRDGSFASVLEAKYGREKFTCVLNSVSGAAVEDGIQLLKPFGQFVEFGKRDFYDNRPMFMKQLRRNITFHGVDTDQLLKYEPELAKNILTKLMMLLAGRKLFPLLHQSSNVSLLGSVMADMQASHHTGKLVLTHSIPENTPIAQSFEVKHNCTIPSQGGIAVIGGSQGFGFELVETLARLGAKNIYAITRSGNFSDEYQARIDQINNQTGCIIEPLKADASNYEQLDKAFCEIRKKAGKLTGVVQAAMVLHDGVAANSTQLQWQEVFNAKTKICDAVDKLTTNDELALYLIFSSATTMIGNPGQANYVAANRILEHRAELRAKEGKPGLAIGWGAIGNTGYLARNSGVKSVLEKVIGQPALQAAQAMALFKQIVNDKTAPAIVHAMPANWSRLHARLKTVQSRAFSGLVRYSQASGGDEDNFIEKLRQLPADQTLMALSEWLREKLADALRVDAQSLAFNQALMDMGLDSLLAVEFASTLEAGLDITMDASQVNAEMTLLTMAEQLHGRLFGEQEERSVDAETKSVQSASNDDEVDEMVDKMARQHLRAEDVVPDVSPQNI